MLIKKIKTAAVVLLALAGSAFAYDLKTVELVPVKFQKAPVHAPVKLVENGKLNFAIVADLNAERRMQKRNKTAKSIEPAIAFSTDKNTTQPILIAIPASTA